MEFSECNLKYQPTYYISAIAKKSNNDFMDSKQQTHIRIHSYLQNN